MARKKIKKVSVVPIDPIEGAVSDTLNITIANHAYGTDSPSK